MPVLKGCAARSLRKSSVRRLTRTTWHLRSNRVHEQGIEKDDRPRRPRQPQARPHRVGRLELPDLASAPARLHGYDGEARRGGPQGPSGAHAGSNSGSRDHATQVRAARGRSAARRDDRRVPNRRHHLLLGSDGASPARRRRQGPAPDRGRLQHSDRLQPFDCGFHHLFSAPLAAVLADRQGLLGARRAKGENRVIGPQPSNLTGTGATCQICSAYSRTARSDENGPMAATLRIDIRVHRSVPKTFAARSCVAMKDAKSAQLKKRSRPSSSSTIGRNAPSSALGRRGISAIARPSSALAATWRFGSSPAFWSAAISSAVFPKMKMFSGPTASRISMFAPSRVPIVTPPFSAAFMLPVPEASYPAVEICSERSTAGKIFSAHETP